jgi:hypothetical protein
MLDLILGADHAQGVRIGPDRWAPMRTVARQSLLPIPRHGILERSTLPV